jgi:hypothetical protein
MAMQRGSLFGIGVETEFALPLGPETPGPCVSIKVAEVALPSVPPIMQTERLAVYSGKDEYYTFSLTNARFTLSATEIVIHASSSVAADLLVFFAWPLLLSILGKESLHACVVERGGHGLAVLGTSGAGKSTTALRLIELGFRVVADDLLVFGQGFQAIPGPPFIRLRPDQAEGQAGQWDSAGKFRCAVPTCDQPIPINQIVVLDDTVEHTGPVSGARGVDLLIRNMASGFVLFPNQRTNRFALATAVAGRIPLLAARSRSLTRAALAKIVQ